MRKWIKIAALQLLLLMLSLTHVYGGILTDTITKPKYLVIPVFFKAPETGISYGISGSMSFKTSKLNQATTRTSVIQGIGFLTTKKQNVQALDAIIYFPKENYVLLLQIAHSYFPDKFWGLGTSTQSKEGEHYVFEQEYFNPHIKRKVTNYFSVGALYEFQSVNHIAFEKGGIFDSASFYGKKSYKVSGLGLSLNYDTRNFTFWPDKGVYFQSKITEFNKIVGSDFKLNKWVTDLRYFKTILKGQIMALQLFNYTTSGQVPLRELASLGGANNLRGFYQGRYRDKNLVTFIGEYRLHINGKFSACAFGGFGDVYNKIKDLRTSQIKHSYGAGLRYSILEKDKLNIRVDYGYSSKHNHGLYVTVGECF